MHKAVHIRLLIVEDSEGDAILISKHLSRSGYTLDRKRVETASQLQFELANSVWDLVITDYKLPEFSGPLALKLIREYSPLTPCLVITGAMTEDIAVEIMRAGAGDFILKQNMSRLVPAVERELREAATRRRQLELERFQANQNKVLECLAVGQPLNEVLTEATALVEQAIPYAGCALLLCDPITQSFRIGAVRNLPVTYSAVTEGMPLQGSGLPDWQARQEKQTLYITDLEEYIKRFPRSSSATWFVDNHYRVLRGDDLCCLWSLPIWGEGGRHALPLGMLVLYFTSPRDPKSDEEDGLTSIVNLIRVILERKEEEIKRHQAESRLRTVLSHLPVVVWAADKDGTLTFVEGQDVERIGLPAEGGVGSSLFDLYQRQPEISANFRKALNARQSHWEMAFADSVFETNVTHVPPEMGGLMIGVTRDITESKQLQAQLIHSTKLAAMGELVAGVVHELNNPLAVISGTAELLATGSDAEIIQDVETILRMVGRMDKTIRSLLNFSRRNAEERISADINDLVIAAAEMTRFSLKRTDTQLILDLDRSIPNSSVFPGQIEQVIVNLIRNAEYAVQLLDTERRQITVQTGWSLEGDNSYAFVSLADQGMGIPPEILPRIFEPFFTTKPGREGTGLGLSICQGIVASHGGTLTVTSEPGAGTIFHLRLPLESDPGSEMGGVA